MVVIYYIKSYFILISVLLHGKEVEIILLKLRARGRVEMGCFETPHLL